MTIVGLDDTDSRERGMCTTYLAARLAEAVVDAGGRVDRKLLIRLNPAVEHKTRGNAALALHVDLEPEHALDLATAELEPLAETADPRTSPGVVVADDDPSDVPEAVSTFTRRAIRDFLEPADALRVADDAGYVHRGWAGGRGRIGALAAVGAWAALEEWTYEHISYRAFDRCGTPREVNTESVFDAAAKFHPQAWDTVDREEDEPVCVPNAPGPILYGIRGDDPDAVSDLAARIDSESIERSATFLTNQGTDVHLREGTLGELRDGRAYRIDGTVASDPETRRGGHVFFDLEARGDADDSVDCVAFEPTKRFRDRVRALRSGDEVTVCGEVSDGTIKLEKFAVRSLRRTVETTPTCGECGRSMESAGRNQGYRCRDCGTSRSGPETVSVDRDLDVGWYEVPPCARRHIAKPLVRGGFDAPTHPER
ncbi:tRNA(Ile)(2)-agmatinylcytidine synthase [Halobellus sp. H-GB7]|uniref:tRNA(Ile)(2)-agmatinylcytidine synthase n=1 Tax=Halobellus sp. H-GB7 TaxID=3069756 RepID=UPI0027B167F9|nr:tRNA(Ile)(2)-agmatinylcytidine synthase [Halobellus sp. H-GB7]MDQ2054942.1 tRNA(Ile)(2)-agmatinylcytidine synthase [Halobellus sp. H-GB7]